MLSVFSGFPLAGSKYLLTMKTTLNARIESVLCTRLVHSNISVEVNQQLHIKRLYVSKFIKYTEREYSGVSTVFEEVLHEGIVFPTYKYPDI